jgi:regulator of sigma E protease
VVSFLTQALAFLVTIGILVTVHEFGHFWVARRLGVKVLRFSVGFGRPLWRRQGRDGTEYVIAAIPLGGYVKMLDEREDPDRPIPPEELPRAFNRQSLRARSAIVAAGPLANFLFAIAALWLVLVLGETGLRPLVGEVVGGSAAERAGFRAGDEILAVEGRQTPTWGTLLGALLVEARGEGDIRLRVRDEAQGERQIELPGELILRQAEQPEFLRGLGLVPRTPTVPPLLGEVRSGEAAAAAGLRSGDLLLRLDGEALESWGDFTERVRERPGDGVELEIERDGQRLLLSLRIGGITEDGRRIGRVGAAPQIPDDLYADYRAVVRLGPGEAVTAAVAKTWDTSVLILRVFGRLLVGEASLNNLGGPIAIAQSAGRSAEVGGITFLKFLADISIILAVMNLLPVPLLDGGHLLYFLAEAVKGSALSERAQMIGQQIGIAFLLTLMGLAFYMDIARLLG